MGKRSDFKRLARDAYDTPAEAELDKFKDGCGR